MGVDAQMLVKHRAQYTPDQVLALAVALAEAFGPQTFMIWSKEDSSWATEDRHALEIVNEYEQDGDSIIPEAGEQFIEVHLAGRYYGPGYERGNLPDYIAVANWLEARIPGCSIFYGGDSSGICAEPFDAKGRAKYWEHFCRVGHAPYTGAFGSFQNSPRMVCSFCKTDMANLGGGGGNTYFSCMSCNRRVIYEGKTGKTIKVKVGEDFFTAHKRTEA